MSPVLFEILVGLADGPAPAAELQQRLENMEGVGPVPVATFYRQLKRALEADWVRVETLDASAGPGRPGQIYASTAAGRAAMESEARRLRLLADRVLLRGDRA